MGGMGVDPIWVVPSGWEGWGWIRYGSFHLDGRDGGGSDMGHSGSHLWYLFNISHVCLSVMFSFHTVTRKCIWCIFLKLYRYVHHVMGVCFIVFEIDGGFVWIFIEFLKIFWLNGRWFLQIVDTGSEFYTLAYKTRREHEMRKNRFPLYPLSTIWGTTFHLTSC